MSPSGIATECTQCGASLEPHNLTGLCAQCKLIARNRRLSDRPADVSDPVTKADAIADVTVVLGGRIIWEGQAIA
jgi:hypothetical protein